LVKTPMTEVQVADSVSIRLNGEQDMNFQEILTLIKHNSTPDNWNIVSTRNAIKAYCLEDVNLRLTTSIVDEGGVQHFKIEILYAATTIFSYVLPNVAGDDEKSRFESALSIAVERVRENAS